LGWIMVPRFGGHIHSQVHADHMQRVLYSASVSLPCPGSERCFMSHAQEPNTSLEAAFQTDCRALAVQVTSGESVSDRCCMHAFACLPALGCITRGELQISKDSLALLAGTLCSLAQREACNGSMRPGRKVAGGEEEAGRGEIGNRMCEAEMAGDR